MTMSLSLDQLAALDAVDRHGTFAAAASALHRTTSAISYSVRTLEEHLGIELFDRSGHRAVLTPEGRLVLEEGRAVLTQARQLEDTVRKVRQGWEPRLLVVLDGSLPLPPVMRALRRFGDQALPTRIRLKVEYLSGVEERFHEAGAHLMLSIDHRPGPELTARPLPPVEMVLVAHREHPLFALVGPIDRAALAPFVELTVADSGSVPPDRPHRLSFQGPQVFQLSDFHSKREALLACAGFGWVPWHLAQADVEAGTLALVPLDEGSRHVFLPHLVHRRDVPLGRGARLFVTLLDEELER
jgi:DNA-binding transcriptional LysR family regulator